MLRELIIIVAVVVAMPACSKDDAPAPAPATPPAESAATMVLPPSLGGGAASALAAASATAPTAAPASASAAATPSASAAATATAPTPAAGASSAKGAPTCGDKPLPPCPLYAWMKKNTSAAMSSQDFDALATALDKVVTFAPKEPGYSNWASISRDGAAAAKVQNLNAVKASCRGCHNQYKDKYKKEMRDRPL